jgi:Plant transposon protein
MDATHVDVIDDPFYDEVLDEPPDVSAVLAAALAHLYFVNHLNLVLLLGKKKADHRRLPRKKKRVFLHQRALECIRHDLTGPNALFVGKEFKMFFRVSRSRFQNMLEMFGNHGGKFYSGKADCCRNPTASLEAKLLLPLQVLAFGVPSHTFVLYYQMSPTLAAKACKEFNKKFLSLYRNKYLKKPSQKDMVQIAKLHEYIHGVSGMFGSLDCMHTRWDKCPTGWQGSFKGRTGHPSIVLEAACDHHCFFWHLDYGHAGTNNDINVLNASDFYQSFLDGRMEQLEEDVVPFKIGSQSFHKMFVLVDGAYPKFDRFVKPFAYPILSEEKKFADWQSAARKDIERAFGILQGMFQAVARPFRALKITDIATMVKCCLCLHNMCMADRVMHGDLNADYDPAHDLDTVEAEVQQCALFRRIYRQERRSVKGIGLADAMITNPAVYKAVTRRERFLKMSDAKENDRLFQALMERFKTTTD